MKSILNKIALLFFCCAIYSFVIAQKSDRPLAVERQNLLSKGFEMKIPTPFHTQKDNYEEGVIYFYSFIDTAYIIIFQGALMEFPIDQYQPQITKFSNTKKITMGKTDNKYWRKDVLDNIRIYYGNVTSENSAIYDSVLNHIKIVPLK